MKLPYLLVSCELTDRGYCLGLKPYTPEVEKPDRKERMQALGAPKEVVEQLDGVFTSFEAGFHTMMPEQHDHPMSIEAQTWIYLSKEQFAQLEDPSPGTIMNLELSIGEVEK